ncbi:MAG: LPS assembly protein LptD [bacterium]|nr:LPS assembly protein LptD [bacterium]
MKGKSLKLEAMFRSYLLLLIIALGWCGISRALFAQTSIPDSLQADSTRIALPVVPIVAAPDSALADTTQPAASETDTTIQYSARSIEFLVDGKRTFLRGNAQVTYKKIKLLAEQIIVDWDNNQVIASGVPDTLWADSLKTVIDTVIVKGRPVFSEGDQEIIGEQMTYNLKSGKGRVTSGTTRYLDGYYWGAALKKENSEVLYAGPGSFTTCDKADPHYRFRSEEMKLMVGNKVVAKPLVLYFGDVPVAAIPFGVFPARSGRQSGIIIPNYGESGVQGRFLRHLGYYWATNDYCDFTGSLDFYEKSGFLLSGRGRYNWRYHLSGTVDGAYINQHYGDVKRRRWELKVGHDQTIDPFTKLRVDANIVSDGSYYRDYSFNFNEQLSQTLRSDATLTRNFPDGKNSVSLNLHHEQNLANEEISQDIPRITYRHGQTAIFPKAKKAPDDTTSSEPLWFNNIYYSFTSEAIHRRILDQQTSLGDTSLIQNRRMAAKHTLSMNSPQKIFSYFSISPSLNVNEMWVGETWDYRKNSLGEKISGFAARHTLSTALGLSTKLYGFWVNPLPGVEAIRHTASPSISFNYTPDFSDPAWGYYQQVTDSTGAVTSKDRFYGALYGGTPKGKSMSLGMQLANLFQMKYGSGEKKSTRDLFNLNFSTSYNLAADSMNFAPLSSSFRADPIDRSSPLGPLKSLSIDLSTTHSFYKFASGHEYNNYYFDPRKGKILRLTSFDISANSGISLGKLLYNPEEVRVEDNQPVVQTAEDQVLQDSILMPVNKPSLPKDWYLGTVPWDLQLSFHYTSSRYNPSNPIETFWMNAAIDASIMPNWQISYNTRVDLVNQKVVSAGLTIYRDLHCWEARLVWNPLGIGQGYYLRINVKTSQLQDVKVERRRGQGTFMGF